MKSGRIDPCQYCAARGARPTSQPVDPAADNSSRVTRWFERRSPVLIRSSQTKPGSPQRLASVFLFPSVRLLSAGTEQHRASTVVHDLMRGTAQSKAGETAEPTSAYGDEARIPSGCVL
jgi:hypothetical protein